MNDNIQINTPLDIITPSSIMTDYRCFETYNEYIKPIFIRLKEYLQKCYVGIPRMNSLDHVYDVAIKCIHILNYSRGYSARDGILIVLAALFHDVGHIEGKCDHEERSAKMFPDIANVLYTEYKIILNSVEIETISRIITLHKNDSKGFGPLETILSDADNLEFHPIDTISRRGLKVQDQKMTEKESNEMFKGIFDWTANNTDDRIILDFVKNIHKNRHFLYDVNDEYISNIYTLLQHCSIKIIMSISEGTWRKKIVFSPHDISLSNEEVVLTHNTNTVDGVEVGCEFDIITYILNSWKLL